ncbi:MAG TPA: FAD-dependent oxidoreductase [Xanthomonadaceae bacterium]|jgi:NADPH-dependent 2,4-dienoyl-CoA reductase/sulfur reductase-like enzyme/nitrite reductase/ring-hydroxylating ferredoxin subunit
MSDSGSPPSGPDFAQGIALSSIPTTGVLAGHVDGAPVLLARLHDGLHAVSGACTHYGGPLAEGLVAGEEVRCPWHHACFSLRTGAALRAPGFAQLAVWSVEVVGDLAYVRSQQAAPGAKASPRTNDPERIVIVGGGAAGYAAAERLRALGFAGSLTMLSAEADAPYDRPNLSKDYLAGTAPEDWIPLQAPDFYAERRIDLRLGCEVAAIDASAREVRAANGERFGYDALLFATGAEPRRLPLPGFDRPEVFMLRSLADARALIAATEGASTIALVGAGFIGLEAAAALRARGLAVHVIAPDAVPMERVLGRELGSLLVDLHRANGVQFHLGAKPATYDGKVVILADGTRVPADRVLLGIGVAPRTSLAETAGLAVDNGILVDACLQASVPGHYAAGDVARYPHGGERVRVEHWVHAQRMGQAAAANLLGAAQPFTDVPFFWTHQYDVELRWTGIGTGWDEVRIDGDLSARNATLRYFRGGTLVAAATLGRDLECLSIEAGLAAA